MTSGTLLAAAGCFLWGMVSVIFSPCHLASIPLMVGYVAGQQNTVHHWKGAHYAFSFTSGLFLTIAAVGVICTLLGRMLGDVGSWWTMVVGAVLIWVALDMLGVAKCSMSGGLMAKLKVKGLRGAFFLGLAYGLLSGSCTFGFIAPILAIITVQQEIMTGVLLIVLFGIGHSLPIAVAGSSTAVVRKLVENSTWQGAGSWFRKAAGAVICLLGLYFVINPIWANLAAA
jgi:cytochrome c-type biogenesis protein